MTKTGTMQASPGTNTFPQYPKTVILETTNFCNLKCKMCHVWGEDVVQRRQAGFIQESVWKSAIDELATWEENINLALHGAGEALLHKDFLSILAYATSKENLNVGFLSNGALLSREIADAIMSTNIAWLGFSVDGSNAELYRKYRGTDLRKVEAAIEYLSSLRTGDRPFLFVNMVALPDLDAEEYVRRWVDLVDEVRISKYRPIGRRDFLTEKIPRVPCHLLEEMLVIAWDGQAVLCCEDIWADVPIGRFPEQSLYALWNSTRFSMIRQAHKNGEFAGIPLCAQCDAWSNIFTSIELREGDNLKLVTCPAQTTYQRIHKRLRNT